MNQVIVNTQMKNQIIFKQIDDLEAILTCEYIIQDGIVRCGQKTIGTFVNYERYQSRLFTERDANGISWRVKRWLERRLNRELSMQFTWWINVNYNDAYKPKGDITAIFYPKASGELKVWSNSIPMKEAHAYAFPGNVSFSHTPAVNDRYSFTWSFNYK